MYLSLFLAKKFLKHKKKGFGYLAYVTGIVTTTIGISCLLSFVLCLQGMEKTIQNKILNLSGHIFVKKQTWNDLKEQQIPKSLIKRLKLKKNTNIDIVTTTSKKMGMLKNDKALKGVVFKGIDYNRKVYKGLYKYLLKGKVKFGKKNNGIIISSKMAQNFKISLGDYILGYFISDYPKVRKLKIEGIYQTYLPEIDEKTVICSQRLIQKINKWHTHKTGNIELYVKDINKIDLVQKQVNERLPYGYNSVSIKRLFTSIFDWFKILNQNKIILIIIILLISCSNLCSILIIKMLESTKYIGILSTLGAPQNLIYKIFFWISIDIIWRGLLFGNILGVGFCALQEVTKFIRLDVEGVFIPYAIIDWNIPTIIKLNLILVISLSLLISVFLLITNKIKKIKLIQFN